jgi:putative two-component system response regulator
LERKRILVIDNSRETFALCKKILNETYELIPAVGAAEGVRTALEKKPDLILLVLYEEIRSECGVCRKLAEQPATSNIPLVILYPSEDESIIEKASSLGAVDYISKPIIPTLFSKRIQTVIERFSGRIHRCTCCLKPMQADWSFCPYDGTPLKSVGLD